MTEGAQCDDYSARDSRAVIDVDRGGTRVAAQPHMGLRAQWDTRSRLDYSRNPGRERPHLSSGIDVPR